MDRIFYKGFLSVIEKREGGSFRFGCVCIGRGVGLFVNSRVIVGFRYYLIRGRNFFRVGLWDNSLLD